jgi:hypothetical protein
MLYNMRINFQCMFNKRTFDIYYTFNLVDVGCNLSWKLHYYLFEALMQNMFFLRDNLRHVCRNKVRRWSYPHFRSTHQNPSIDSNSTNNVYSNLPINNVAISILWLLIDFLLQQYVEYQYRLFSHAKTVCTVLIKPPLCYCSAGPPSKNALSYCAMLNFVCSIFGIPTFTCTQSSDLWL